MSTYERSVVVAGVITIDMVYESPSLIIKGGKIKKCKPNRTFVGGMAARVAMLLADLSCEVSLISQIGDDAPGIAACEELAKHRVNGDYVIQESGSVTTSSFIVIEPDCERSVFMAFHETLCHQELSQPQIDEVLSRGATLVLDASGNLRLQRELAKSAKQQGKVVIADIEDPSARDLLPDCTLVKFPASFLQEAFPLLSREEALRTISRSGPRVVGVTCGKDGSLFYDRERQLFVETAAFSVPLSDTVDTTAAGDWFTGGWVYGLQAKNMSLEESLRFASACGSFAVEEVGIPETPQINEIMERMAGIQQSVRPAADCLVCGVR